MPSDLSRRRLLHLTGAAGAAVVLTGTGPQALAVAAGSRAPKESAPTGMLVDLLPQGLGNGGSSRPRFSWQVPDFGPGTVQRAYEVQVASSPDGFGSRSHLLWDSGRIASADSTAVPYSGHALAPRTAYWWRVRSWADRPSAWSEPVLLATAVEDRWEATPIWVPQGPVLADGTLSVRVQITGVAAGLWFRAAGTNDNYLWQLRAGTNGVLRKHICVGGTYTVLGETTLPFPVEVGDWLDYSVTMAGSAFTTAVNGTVVDTTTDTRYASGNVGLRNGSTESQLFDSFTFTAPDGTVLLRDDFTTDRGTFTAGTVANGVLAFPRSASSLSSYSGDTDWALLRTEYRTAAKEIAAAVLYVAATSPAVAHQYVAKVWSNGTPVGFASPRTATGPAYQAFDITTTLRRGKGNALAALCWTTSDQKFLAQLEITYADGSRQTVGSGPSWRARQQKGLLPAKDNAGTSSYTAPQEYWDLRAEPVGWTAPGCDDGDWFVPAVRPAIEGLAPALIEPVRLHDVTPASFTKAGDGRWLVDLGREIVGGLALELTGTAGQTVEVRLGEELNDDGTVRYQLRATNTYLEQWTLRDGDQRIEHWGYRAFRWAELRVDASLDLSSATVRGRAWRLDWHDEQSAFRSSDPDLDRVHALSRYSIEATRDDLYQDSPTRERGPYEGDALINQRSEFAVQRSYALARYSNDYLLAHGTWPTEYRLMCSISAWEEYLATGDDRQLAANYAQLTAKNLTAYLGADGLVHKAPGSSSHDLGDLVDWPDTNRDGYVFTDVNTVVNAWQYASFTALARIAGALGRKTDARALQDRAAALAGSMRGVLLDGDAGEFLDGVGTTHSAQHATAFPVALGVADGLPDQILNRLGDTLAAGGMRVSVYGSQYLLDALFRLGRSDAALSLLTSSATNSWLHMLDSLHATIVTEAWDPALKSNMTFSHAWASAPANVIPRHVLGVQVSEPGAAAFLIRPRTGPLTEVHGTVPSIRGPVSVSQQRSGRHHRLRVSLPPNTSAVLDVEIGSAHPADYTVHGSTPGGRGRLSVTPYEDLTGTVLRVGTVGSGATTVERTR